MNEINQVSKSNQKSTILKLCLFATGLSGIVAEYILSTLASYFLGDSILQWTLVLSFMLFSMGLGSRLSKYLQGELLEKFIMIEFLLSVLVAFSAALVYVVSAYTIYNGLFIYFLSIAIGLMIGLEIPLVTRLNDEYETLRVNIASVMEKDYYGSLVGGIFFAFVGLPYLGMTYTPFVLGVTNFAVALVLYFKFKKLVNPARILLLNSLTVFVLLLIVSGVVFSKEIILFGEQKKYQDQVIYEKQSKYQKIVITQWRDNYWLFINGSQQLSTLDEAMYHEPLVHPLMKLSKTPQDILVLGGGDGAAAREILKYREVKNITLVDLDPVMTDLAKNHSVLLTINDSSFFHPKVKIINQDAFKYLSDTKKYFDIVIIDLPDPRTVELGRLYSREFYRMCYRQLRPHGLLITQSGSPYYSSKAFECINLTMQAAGFQTLQIHNQIITLGEWGWTIGAKQLSSEELKKLLQKIDFNGIKTKWINREAMFLMTSFGKKDFFIKDKPEINTIHNPVLYRYYLKGNWDLY